MRRSFDFGSINAVEFGICKDTDEGENFVAIPVDHEVKKVLKSMLMDTLSELGLNGDIVLETYDPSQKYGSKEPLQLQLNNEMVQKIRGLYEANNVPTNSHALDDLENMIFYFAIFHDNKKRKVLAIKRAKQFKGVIKARNRFIRIVNETLKMLDDNIFKLDKDFDYIVTNLTVYILRPSAFEFTAHLDKLILAKAKESTEELHKDISCVDFSSLADYVSQHKRAARLISSLRSRNDLKKTSEKRLKSACKKNGVELVLENGRIKPAPGHELAFLYVLDRRRYNISLIDNVEEIYEAPNRHSVRSVK